MVNPNNIDVDLYRVPGYYSIVFHSYVDHEVLYALYYPEYPEKDIRIMSYNSIRVWINRNLPLVAETEITLDLITNFYGININPEPNEDGTHNYKAFERLTYNVNDVFTLTGSINRLFRR